MASTAQWVAGARPRTLSAAIAPVAIGCGAAVYEGAFQVGLALLALLVALALQVAVNYANDYSDGVRGTDDDRVGPQRLVGGGLAEPGAVKRAALLAFAVAGVAGLALVVWSQVWWLLPIGLASVAAAWFYTGGSSPYGYRGLGEVSVFVFFGMVATTGTAWAQIGELTWAAVIAGIPPGLWSSAILLANNIRDIPGDTDAGKRTLAVRLGDRRARVLYSLMLLGGFAIAALMMMFTPWAALALLALPLAIPPIRAVHAGAVGPELIGVLGATSMILLVGGLLLAVGLASPW